MSRHSKPKSVDTVLLIFVILLVGGGFLIFSSASLGLMARDGASFGSVAFSQFVFGVLGGGTAMLFISNIYYRHWRKYAFYLFFLTLIATLAVFIPGLGMTHAGATRWLDLGVTTVQPSEFLKIGFVIYLATWLSGFHDKVRHWKYGLVPFTAITGLVGGVMLLQPDTGTFLIMAVAGMAMFIVSGASWRDITLVILGGLLMLVVLAMLRPYVMDRLTTFLNPEADPLGSGYQIQQSLIAVGSGGIAGRGFGQSIQKFEYLPEPIGDSVFAVYAEEFGFIGAGMLLIALVFLTLRGYRIATHASDIFGTLLVVGFMTLIVGQAFFNIGAMLAVAPLSGLPLPFISHGGTSLLATLASLGIVLNVSKYRTFRKTS
tara:strand:+ start:16261 stop:17382 length:1122 start_codon:yes stop_codon:yes gene_type:complete